MALTKAKAGVIDTIAGDQVTYASGVGLSSSTLQAALEEMYAIASYRRRQCVVMGPVNSTTGAPNWLPATSVNLNLTSQNISSTAPLVALAANGDTTRRGKSTANLTWTGLTAASTNYLYVDIAASGAMTTGFTTLAPTYQAGGTYSTTNGQFTFNWGEMIGKVGNGTTAAQTYRVFVGEAVTDGSGVTSTVCYAHNGEYISAQTAMTGLAATTTWAHNLGQTVINAEMHLVCISTEYNYAVGDRIIMPMTGVAPVQALNMAPLRGSGRNSIKYLTGNAARAYVLDATTGAYAGGDITAAKWETQVFVRRAW